MALKSKAKGFVYKPRTVDQVKGRATRKNSKFDSILKPGYDNYRPKQGDNLYRYLPPTWDDSDHYGYTAHVHRNIGPDNSTYLCLRKMLNKPCPCCEAAKEAKDAGEAEEAKELGTSERILSWVLDRDADDPEKPLVYEQSWTQDRDITSLCVNERSGEILMIDHPDKGFDVTIKRTGTGMKTKYFGYAIARDDSPIHDSEKAQDEILEYIKDNPIPDILNFYDYEYLQGVLSGTVPAKDEVLDKDVDEEDVKPARKTTSKRVVEEEVDEEDETPQIRTGRSRRPAEVEEDEVPFETKTNKVSRRQVVVEEDETDAPTPRRRVVKEVEEIEEEAPPPRRVVRRPEPVDEEVDEETGEVTEVTSRSRQTAARTTTAGRTRVVEEVDEEDAEPVVRRSTRVR